MDKVYDNGTMVLGNVKNLKDYICRNCGDLEEVKEIIQDLEDLDEDTIVALNYDCGMGYSMDYWKKDDKVSKNDSILDLYNLVFEDMVKNYVEDANYEENEEKITLSEREIKRIANDLIYNDEVLWEYINNSIDNYIGRALLERSEENE